jgi:hypothetical protein
MSDVTEVTIRIKDESKTLKNKYLCYEIITASPNDPIIAGYILESVINFGSDPTDVTITFKFSIN